MASEIPNLEVRAHHGRTESGWSFGGMKRIRPKYSSARREPLGTSVSPDDHQSEVLTDSRNITLSPEPLHPLPEPPIPNTPALSQSDGSSISPFSTEPPVNVSSTKTAAPQDTARANSGKATARWITVAALCVVLPFYLSALWPVIQRQLVQYTQVKPLNVLQLGPAWDAWVSDAKAFSCNTNLRGGPVRDVERVLHGLSRNASAMILERKQTDERVSKAWRSLKGAVERRDVEATKEAFDSAFAMVWPATHLLYQFECALNASVSHLGDLRPTLGQKLHAAKDELKNSINGVRKAKAGSDTAMKRFSAAIDCSHSPKLHDLFESVRLLAVERHSAETDALRELAAAKARFEKISQGKPISPHVFQDLKQSTTGFWADLESLKKLNRAMSSSYDTDSQHRW